MLRSSSFGCLLVLSLAVAAVPAKTTPLTTQSVRLGIMSFSGTNGFTTYIAAEDDLLAKIPEWLSKHVPQVHFSTQYYRMNDLIQAVKEKQVDVFLASSGLFWQMKSYGVRDLATIVSDRTSNPNKGVAGVIFVRDDRRDLNELTDLKGKKVSTGLPNMFLATQLGMASIAQAGA